MSATTLADWIDRLPAQGAFVVETTETVTISNLSVQMTTDLVTLVQAEVWASEIFDQTGESWPSDQISGDLEPFRVVIRKPAPPAGYIRILTNTGFREWLSRGIDASACQVAQLSETFDTLGVRFTSWDDAAEPFTPAEPTASPRSLVRDYSVAITVPLDIRPWLLHDVEVGQYDNSAFQVWMAQALANTLSSLPDEIDAVTRNLKFKGPPRLSLLVNPDGFAGANELGPEGFKSVQRGARWVFDNAREAEMRHVLFATEIARSGVNSNSAEVYMREHAAAALDGAKIGYQASLSQLSADTIKALADLRKAVTEETAKVTEATRQIAGAVAAALAIGIGLMAARVTASASSMLIIAVMVVAAAYVAMVILSGIQFTLLQRGLRKGWQPRLYRYLPTDEYAALVLTPTRKAENSLFWIAGIGAITVLTMGTLVVFPGIWR